jgi:hypothetical protein
MADPQPTSKQTEDAMRSPSGADLVSLLLLILFGFGVWASRIFCSFGSRASNS